ncbi:MAG: sigma-70 family RNA polymerase sigma factor [Ardenticatenaceae bacterium]|nr:sigma-70 family RNA polymerase sigma factor [Anaerolineales bacterium]MCB8921637.1 sigma-70 family RNA polymerase sigma factor [Ardenticatenaceae bacterium]MCB9003331.1 sigma-70 family RNA polymerase sigma factor [Ardenticatenaceae bacterium]
MIQSHVFGEAFLSTIQYRTVLTAKDEYQVCVDVKQLDDLTLMRLIAQGNEAALSELYDRYSRLVLSIAYGVVQNRQTAEEVTLDIFTRAWEKAATYDPQQAKVSTWLVRMTRNRAIDWLRREKIRPFQHSISWGDVTPEAVATENQTETAVQSNLQQQRVRTAVASLPPDQQEALALAYFKGYSHSEIAQVLNQPLGTVKGRIRAAMQKLRVLLEE